MNILCWLADVQRLYWAVLRVIIVDNFGNCFDWDDSDLFQQAVRPVQDKEH